MRATISVNDAIWEHVRLYAYSRDLKLSRAVEELLQRGLSPRPLPAQPAASGLVPFEPPPDAPILTTERLLEMEDEDW